MINVNRQLSPPRKGGNLKKQFHQKLKNKRTMKKLVLFIGLTVLSFGAFAEKVPSVVVNKYNGGWTAILNLYNYVTYTPAELSPTGIGQLDCSGGGFSACRVPNCTHMTVNDGNVVVDVTDAAKLNAFREAVNNVIVQYETALEQQANTADKQNSNSKTAVIPNVYTKTLAMPNSANAKKTDTYVVRGVVTSSGANSSTMKIYIEKANLLPAVGSN